ncbi:MAG: hypothetical protein GY938_05400, partial [Ketobacter sp.]|nr:hypothetical protein [Ketobacter sp.]
MISKIVHKFALLCDNNGVHHWYCKLLLAFADMIQEFTYPDKTHIWKSLSDIKDWLLKLYKQNYPNVCASDTKLQGFVQRNACLLKALLIEKQNISLHNQCGMYNIIYWNTYVYALHSKYRFNLINFSRLFDSQYDVSFNTPIDDTMHKFIMAVPNFNTESPINKCHEHLSVTKNFRIPLDQNISKGRIFIDKHCDVLVFFYPNGNDTSLQGCMASEVQLDIHKKIQWKHWNSVLQISWICGHINRFENHIVNEYFNIENKTNRYWALGLSNTFPISVLQKNNG